MRRLRQGDANPSNDFSEFVFKQDTQRPNLKLTKEPDPIDYSNAAQSSIDSFNYSNIDTSVGTSKVSSDTKLNLRTGLQEHKSIARSRTPLKHSFMQGLRAFDKTGGYSSKRHHQVHQKAPTSYTGKRLVERQSEESSSEERDVQKWNANHNRITIENINKNRGIYRTNFNSKRSKKKKLSLISFNEIRTNNNINNNNNAPGSHNFNTIDGKSIGINGMNSGKNGCWFVVCVGLYVNDAMFNQNKPSKKKLRNTPIPK